LVVAENFRARGLSYTPISAGEAAGIPREPEDLEEPALDSAAMTRETASAVKAPPRQLHPLNEQSRDEICRAELLALKTP
jgi:hypothetical protein